jgi:hypothetical protein
MSGNFDLGGIAYLFIGVPVISVLAGIIVFIIALREKRTPSFPVILSFPLYWIVSWLLFANLHALRDHTRWLLESARYKSAVLAQPDPGNGLFRHVEWDGWGWAGMDTNVYLVFDPSDSLAAAARSHSAGKFRGIPCEVPRVRWLERSWYSVEFYRSSDCGDW